jgi:hypothetical protein
MLTAASSAPAEWSRWNVSLRLAVAPAWPAELVGVAQPATRRMQARTPLVLVAYIRSRRGSAARVVVFLDDQRGLVVWRDDRASPQLCRAIERRDNEVTELLATRRLVQLPLRALHWA